MAKFKWYQSAGHLPTCQPVEMWVLPFQIALEDIIDKHFRRIRPFNFPPIKCFYLIIGNHTSHLAAITVSGCWKPALQDAYLKSNANSRSLQKNFSPALIHTSTSCPKRQHR